MVIKMNEKETRNKIPTFEERENRRRENAGKTERPVSRNGFLVRTLVCQFIFSLLLLISLFVLKKAGPDSFEYFRNKYISFNQRDVSVSEIKSVLKNITSDDVFNRKEEISETEEQISSEQTTEAEPEKKDLKEENDGKGGEDLLPAIDGTSFSPYELSRIITPPLEEYSVTSGFGYRTNPISGQYGFHTGLDMAADEGTKVRAAFDGTVTQTGWTDVRGNYIVLSHGESVSTLYYHCSEILCKEGQFVKAGSVIARVGSTGWSTGPHLHFEIRINEMSCNPEEVLNAAED